MQGDGPTTLHTPEPAGPAPYAQGTIGFAWLAAVLPVVVIIVWLVRRAHRDAQQHPEEHAFRSLAKRLRLRPAQVEQIRRYAREVAGCKPIEVLMHDGMLDQAMSGAD